MNRREILLGTVAVASVVSCTPAQQDAFAKQLENILQQVQAGVAAACQQFGKWVPTIETVVAVLTQIAGGTALAAITQVVIDDAIQTIAKACGPSPAPATSVKGVVVPIKFY